MENKKTSAPTEARESNNQDWPKNTKKLIDDGLAAICIVPPPDSAPPLGVDYTQLFQASILDQAKDYPLPVPVISIQQGDNKVPLLTLGSISLWQGKQKSKKTTVLALAVAAFISGSSEFFHCASEGVAIIIDTEQGQSYAARTMKLILRLAGLDTSPRLIYCDLRNHGPEERWEIIRAAVAATPDLRLIIIDGVVDLMLDFMDAGEGHTVVTQIMRLADERNIHIAGVLHQNKGDNNARAHVGSIFSQKCEMEIATEVDTNDRSRSVVKCVNSRGLPFQDFAIKWEKGSIPEVVNDYQRPDSPKAKSAREMDQAREIVEASFGKLQSYTFSEAIEILMRATTKGERTAERHLKNYTVWGLLEKGVDGRYRQPT